MPQDAFSCAWMGQWASRLSKSLLQAFLQFLCMPCSSILWLMMMMVLMMLSLGGLNGPELGFLAGVVLICLATLISLGRRE